jgi:hypothetical protein
VKRATASLFFLLTVSSYADAGNVTSLLTLTGKCQQLIAGNRDMTKGCIGKAINVNYDDGRSGFYFVIADLAVLTFSGMGNQQVKLNADEVVQPIDTIIFGLSGAGTKPNSVHAVGSCQYSNPYKGKSFIRCQSTTSQGKFSADFETDGKPPQ